MHIPAAFGRLALFLLPLVVIAPAHAAHDGARLYAANCAACHGSNGTGGVGVPLALPDFLSQADDDYLRKTIRHGRPGRVMPAFTKLSDAEVNAIVRQVRSWQTVAAVPVPKVGRGDAANGAKLYATRCASCHGARGEGGHGTGVTFSRPRNLPVLPPALNNAGFLASATDAMIKAVLEHGRASTPMVSFRRAGLSDRDLDDLVAHVRGFAKTSPAAAVKHTQDDPPVLVRVSGNSMKDTIERLKGAISGANMKLIRIAPYDEGLLEKGQENSRRMLVDACDFEFVNQALAVDPRIGLFLPCRFTLVEEAGKVRIMTINPKRLAVLFNNTELDELCAKMHAVYVDILEEATL
ncbi:MAG: c-type cytochrome [Gammaproteobacteria bacterium]|nr:c-type cytochrome [Gammaproteobacteria bacterium]